MNIPLPSYPADEDARSEPRAVTQSKIYGLLRLTLAATVVILAVWLLKDVLTVVFASALFAVILHGIAKLLQRFTRMPFWLSLTIVILGLAGLLVGFVLLVGPGLGDQVVKLKQALIEQSHGIHDRLDRTQWGQLALQQVPSSMGGDKEGGGSPGVPSGLAGSVAGFLGSLFGLFGTIVVVIIAGLYLAAAPATYVNGALRLVAEKHRPKAKELCLAAGSALWSWSAGQALDMLVVGILSGVGLWIIGVPLALALGVLAGLFNFVPYIGAIIGAIPAIVIAFSLGATTGIETTILYLVIQGFEGNVMAPLIQNRAVHLPPGLTILSQTAFGSILGIPGLIFATPLTAAILAVMTKATKPLDQNDHV
ncbi:AI-2E family transporter [Lichenicola cladoniae]|uniref:AI-2E family transporter n=1 Tax=Lichenicola cladoniae TaxID=1484109 RepID=A0A6M8HU05_9PROT|nr:AI-2E family transporter [Lichenicola cladoniae]NPD66147.1 AI-2E family transporter [Acetobacteraceae bacterium]QKE92014.1 AI-2E family transporter [Lichenicola cladoniae]